MTTSWISESNKNVVWTCYGWTDPQNTNGLPYIHTLSKESYTDKSNVSVDELNSGKVSFGLSFVSNPLCRKNYEVKIKEKSYFDLNTPFWIFTRFYLNSCYYFILLSEHAIVFNIDLEETISTCDIKKSKHSCSFEWSKKKDKVMTETY